MARKTRKPTKKPYPVVKYKPPPDVVTEAFGGFAEVRGQVVIETPPPITADGEGSVGS